MSVRSRFALIPSLLFPLLGFVSACGADSPTSPAEEADASIAPPQLILPGPNAVVAMGTTPLTLVIENSAASGSATRTYTFEVATDDSFATPYYAQYEPRPSCE